MTHRLCLSVNKSVCLLGGQSFNFFKDRFEASFSLYHKKQICIVQMNITPIFIPSAQGL